MVPRSDRGQQASLSVNLKDIPEEGLVFDCEVSPVWLELPTEDGQVHGDFHWEGTLLKTSEGAFVSGTLSGVIIRECVRCLQEYPDRVVIPCKATFEEVGSDQPKLPTSDKKLSYYDDQDNIGEEWYPCDGNQVELGKMLREQVILTAPIQPLCRQDCLGLCEKCGRNLNEGPCRCTRSNTGSPQGTIRFRVGKPKTVM